MIKQLLTFAALFLGSNLSHSQITFQKTFGDQSQDNGRSVQQTTDGGYIIVGTWRNPNIPTDDQVFLIKTDVNGDTLWTKRYGGSSSDNGYAVRQTTDGGYIIVAYTNSFGAGDYDFYLIKTDAGGNLIWSKAFGGTYWDICSSIQQTSDGGYILSGTRYTPSPSSSSSIHVIKTDTNGDTLWTKTFNITSLDVCSSVTQTTDGGYIILGNGSTVFVSSADIYLIKTDAIGNITWSKTIGGTNNDYAYSLRQTTDGGYIISGSTRSFGGVFFYDLYLVKTDDIGNLIWSKTYGGAGFDNQYGLCVQQTTDGGYIVAGSTNTNSGSSTDIYLIKTNMNGDSLWTRTYGGAYDEGTNAVLQTNDGGYLISGLTKSFGTGPSDAFLIKTDTNGHSGCNELSDTTIVTTPLTVIAPATFTIGSPSTVVTSPATAVSSGCIVSTLCTSVGIMQLADDNAPKVFPNPSDGNFIVSFNNNIINGNILLLNITGEIVFEQNISNESKKAISLENTLQGLFLMKVFDGEKYYCKKIIIEQN